MQNEVLFSMLMSLLARPRTAAQLAEKFELSVRSVYRYLDTLECAGIPLMRKNGCKGGFCIDSAHFIEKTYFTDDELKHLIGLAEGARLGGKTADSVADKLDALARMHASERYRILPDTLVIDADSWAGGTSDTIAALQRAVEDRTALKIEYSDSGDVLTARIVYPHTLVLKRGLWYLYAYCTLREDWRLFSVVRIRSLAPAGKFSRMAYDLENVPWRTLPAEDACLVAVSADAAAAAYLGDRYRVKDRADGTLAFFAPINRSLVSELARLDVTVIAPEALREQVKDRLAAQLLRYSE